MMKENYIYFVIALLIWIIISFILKFLIFPSEEIIAFYGLIVFMAINIVIHAIGYINYKLDEKPYVLAFVLNSCPLILSSILLYTEIRVFILAFIFIPIVFTVVLVLTLAISGDIGGFELKHKELFKYLLIIPAYYGILLLSMFILSIFNALIGPPFWLSILIFALNYIFLIPIV